MLNNQTKKEIYKRYQVLGSASFVYTEFARRIRGLRLSEVQEAIKEHENKKEITMKKYKINFSSIELCEIACSAEVEANSKEEARNKLSELIDNHNPFSGESADIECSWSGDIIEVLDTEAYNILDDVSQIEEVKK